MFGGRRGRHRRKGCDMCEYMAAAVVSGGGKKKCLMLKRADGFYQLFQCEGLGGFFSGHMGVFVIFIAWRKTPNLHKVSVCSINM